MIGLGVNKSKFYKQFYKVLMVCVKYKTTFYKQHLPVPIIVKGLFLLIAKLKNLVAAVFRF